MNRSDTIGAAFEAQKAFFVKGETKGYPFRLKALCSLREAIIRREADLCRALTKDFRKSAYEAYLTEIGMVKDELSYHIRHLKSFMRPKRVRTALSQLPGKSVRFPEPYGVVLIMSPWNYPVNLCFEPLIGAISGGNCAIVKPSAYTPHTSSVIADLLREAFDAAYITVVEGGREENQALLEMPFDYIFFTGSVSVGKLVMEKAAKYLTPVSLELGGKSPVIVDETADIGVAAKRIAFGKILNAGQTCVAPDYLLIAESRREAFVSAFAEAVRSFFPSGDFSEMPVIVNEKHFTRLQSLLSDGTVVYGEKTDPESRFIPPTLLTDIKEGAQVMEEEIFGPILPIITFKNIEEAIEIIRKRPKPLALYLFTTSKANQKKIFADCSFGGGCVNDTILHLATSYMPFGGVGDSGMGAYHGKYSFDTFSHYRSVLLRPNRFDNNLRYHPYTEQKKQWLRRFLK